jgi:hypothetical protein
MCAEEVLAAARLCRFCGYRFDLEGSDDLAGADAARESHQPSVAPPPAVPHPQAADQVPTPPPRRRRARTVALVVLACVLVAIVAVGAVAVMSRKSLSDAEMAYAGKVVREPYKSSEYYMIGTAMAAQRQAGALTGRRPTAAARAKAKAFFAEGDAYYRRLLALESPSELFDESHAAFLRAVGSERRLLTAVRDWYNDPWGDKGEAASHAASRLFDKAKTADERSWKLFTGVLKAEASEEQVRRINQLMAKYRKEMKRD